MKIGLIIDDDDYRKRTIKNIKSQFKIYKPKYIEDIGVTPKILDEDGFDLIIVDYGGLTSIPGNSLGEHYARYINKYAEDHPNTLMVYVTVMGEHYLRDEGLNLDELYNIRWCKTEDLIYLWKKWKLK